MIGVRNLIPEDTDSRHFNLYRIALLHSRDARRRSSRNQVAGIQCHDLRDVPYKKGDRKRHVSRVAFLFHFTVEASLDCNIVWVDIGLDPRTHGTERVKRFTTSELHVLTL